MKTILTGTGCFLSVVAIAVGFITRFLLYRWLHVPDYLWILFWIDVPFTVAISVVGEALKTAARKSDDE